MGIEFEKIKLRDYQQEAIDNMYELFDEGKRSATVVLPTGGGKTYVALEAMAREMKPSDKEGVISETSIFYFAPNDGIVQQTLERISEYMIGDRPEYKGLSVEAKVKKAFPNLKVKCYQSMKSRKNGDTLSKENDEYLEDVEADFCILDEAHRAAAETFGKKIESFVKAHKKTKFLSITATPERDADSKNIMDVISMHTGYDYDEIAKNKYVAYKLNLLEAIEKGLVVKPEIVFFSCTLDETDEYKKIEEAYFKAIEKDRKSKTHNGKTYKELDNLHQIYEEMNIIIGKAEFRDGKYHQYTDEEWNKIKNEKIKEILKDRIKVGDKAIVFIPDTPSDTSSEEVIEMYKEKVRELVKENVEESRIFIEPYHSKVNTSAKNREILKEFNETGKDKYAALITYKMLDEGVHAEGVNSEFMFKQIDSERDNNDKQGPAISLLQKLGRAIVSTNSKDTERPKIYDFGANFVRNYTQFLEMGDGKQTFYELPEEMNEFLNLYQMFETRSKIKKISWNLDKKGNLKFIGASYGERDEKIEFPVNSKPNDAREIRELIDSIKSGKKFKKDLTKPKKTSEKYTAIDKDKSKRFEYFKNITQVLRNNGIQINSDIVLNEEFFENISKDIRNRILKEIHEKTKRFIKYDNGYKLGDELKYFKRIFWQRTEKTALEFFEKKDPKSKKASSVLDSLDKEGLENLFNMGILNVKMKDLEELPEDVIVVDQNGFIKANAQCKFPESFIGKNIYTGTEFSKDGKDEYGCYADGYDDNGYDRYGFDRAGLHRITREIFDQRGFYKDENGEWKNKFTDTDYDKLGYNHDGINRRGFDRANMWHEKLENGNYSRNFFKRNKKGIDAHGFDSVGNCEGIVGFKINPEGYYVDGKKSDRILIDEELRKYNIDGYDENGFNKEGICKNTSCKVNRRGCNTKGELVQEFQITLEVFKYIKSIKFEEDEKKKNGKENFWRKIRDNFFPNDGIPINEMKDVIDEKMAEAYTLSSIASECEEAKKMKEEVVKLSMTNPDLIQRFVKFSPRLEADLRRESISLNKALVALNKMLDEKLKKAKVDEKEVEEIKKKYSEVDIRKKNIDRIAPPNPRGSLSNTDNER